MDICTHQRDTCINDLKEGIYEEIYKECTDFEKRVRKSKHAKNLERQRNTFERLCQQTRDSHSYHTSGNPKSNNEYNGTT